MTGALVRFRYGGTTDTGRVRSNNQDAFLASDRVFVVADGMGGHQGGEVASRLAVEKLEEHVVDATTPDLLEGVRLANRMIVEQAESDLDLRGMGTTVCLLAPVDTEIGPRLAVVNVGDSRLYRYAGEELRQVTEDHSLVESLVREGRLTSDEAAVHPQRNILTRALGVSEDLELDWWELPVRPGDRYVLCSDGLFNELTEDQIAAVLRRLAEPADAADELVRLALEAGGRDNVTVVVVDVVAAGDGPAGEATDEAGPTDVADDPGEAGEGPIPRPSVVRASFDRPIEDLAGFSTAVSPGDPDTGDLDAGEPDPPEPAAAAAESARPASGASRRSWSRWRVSGYVGLLAVVAVGAIVAIGIYARSSYFVDVRGDDIVILQGRPGGVLWFDATLEEVTALGVGDLTPALLEEVDGNPQYASLDGARAYVASLADRSAEPTATD